MIGPLINGEFYRWVVRELHSDVMARVDDNFYYQPSSSVPQELHWLSVFVNDSMVQITPATDSDCLSPKHFYLAFEQEFNCSDRNCVFHHNWCFHFRRIDLDEETIQGSYDFGVLEVDVEAWLESFLELRFPAISFDFESLVNGQSMPPLKISYTY